MLQDMKENPRKIFLMIVSMILFYIPFIGSSITKENYTSIINQSTHPLLFFLSVPIGFCILYYLVYQYLRDKTLKIQTIPLFILVIISILMPYDVKGSFYSSMHLFLGYACFIWFNYLIFKILQSNTQYHYYYLYGVIFAAVIALTFQSINGLSEWIYFSWTTMILLCIKK